ncbi:hypothetical protein M8J77_002776 [Diaphorina citri]|nr:hypothetical protein M8J77_002776 [Diaphorina citri]
MATTSSCKNYEEFICGFGAAVINIAVTFPINKIIFRQQLHGVGVLKAMSQVHAEGIPYLYRGILPPLLQKSISTSLMFGMYDKSNLFLLPYLSDHPILMKFTSAMFAGSIEAMLTPFERLQTLLQDSAYHTQLNNTPHLVKHIYKEYGMKEYYRGLSPVLLRNGPSNVVFFIARDEVMIRFPTESNKDRMYKVFIKDFLIGAVIGAINSSVFFPFNVIKIHMQSKLGGSYDSLWQVTREIYIDRGRKLSSFYRGVHMNCTRSFISWGVAMVAYGQLKERLC